MQPSNLTLTTTLLCLISLLLTATASANQREQLHLLSREKIKLTVEISKLLRQYRFHENAEYKKLNNQAIQAAKTFNSTRRNHPSLQSYINKSDATQKKMIDATSAKDQSAAIAARREFSDARSDLEKATAAIPQLEALRQKAIQANHAVKIKKSALLATIPQGKTLISRMQALEEKIETLRDQMAK